MFDLKEHRYTRLNILTGDWILVSPHRMKRPSTRKLYSLKSLVWTIICVIPDSLGQIFFLFHFGRFIKIVSCCILIYFFYHIIRHDNLWILCLDQGLSGVAFELFCLLVPLDRCGVKCSGVNSLRKRAFKNLLWFYLDPVLQVHQWFYF